MGEECVKNREKYNLKRMGKEQLRDVHFDNRIT